MKFSYIPFLLVFMVVGACTPRNLQYQDALERNNDKLDTEEQRKDAAFLVEATDYNLLLKELSQQTSNKAYARLVADFASNALNDHQVMGERIRDLAKEKKIALPSELGNRHQNMIQDITQANKRNVDRVYLNTIEILQERLVRLYEEAALKANDAEIRSYAAAQLDIIRSHSRKAQEIRQELI